MNEPTLKKIHAELSSHLTGRKFGKIFTLSRLQLAMDFRTSDGKYLFISIEPNSPRIYLIKRQLKQLKKQSKLQFPFVSLLRKKVSNATLCQIDKIPDERIFKFLLVAKNELNKSESFTLVFQLTGRSSNVFLLDEDNKIISFLCQKTNNGSQIGDSYLLPERNSPQKRNDSKDFNILGFETLSEALDDFYLNQEKSLYLQAVEGSAKRNLNTELKKKIRLRKKLTQDLKNHGNADKWKKIGNLLLANITTAERMENKVILVDYFETGAPKMEVKVDSNISLTEAAENFFKRYAKAVNAKKQISKRLADLDNEIKKLESDLEKLAQAISNKDIEFIKHMAPKKTPPVKRSKKRSVDLFTGAKRFISSDGVDILVGKRSKDNDYLTFRVAKSLDIWLHAADYPGSHVIVRSPNRREIPQRTLLEAAQLAAFYSKAKNEAKVAVHYTQKKFVNKPRKAKAGLVSLASFKTIFVKPKFLQQKPPETSFNLN